MPINLLPIQKFVEDNMTDQCTIVRDVEGVSDDTWDNATGTYTAPGGDEIEVYTGLCYVSTKGWESRKELVGGAETIQSFFKLMLPLGSPKVLPRDRVVFTASLRYPYLVEEEFTVIEAIITSFAVAQGVLISSRTTQRNL